MLSVLLLKKKNLYCWGACIKLSFKAHLPFSAVSWMTLCFCFKLWMMPLPCIYGTELVFRFQGLCYFTGMNFRAQNTHLVCRPKGHFVVQPSAVSLFSCLKISLKMRKLIQKTLKSNNELLRWRLHKSDVYVQCLRQMLEMWDIKH